MPTRFVHCVCLIASLALATALHAEDKPAEKPGEKPAEKSTAEAAIADAIKLLEARRETAGDVFEQAKIDKAVRELEALIEDPDAPKPESPPPPKITFEVTAAMLKKKFAGKPNYNDKSGELTLTYDFAGKAQLSDFAVNDAKVAINKKKLGIDAGDSIQHVAKFKSFTVSAEMTFKGMRGPGISSSNGSRISAGGPNGKAVVLGVPGGPGIGKPVANNISFGTIPISLTVTPQKTSLRYGPEKLSQPTVRKDDIHQIVLVGGPEGCAFENLIIVGVPDPAWLKDFLGAE